MPNFKLESKTHRAHYNSILTCTWGRKVIQLSHDSTETETAESATNEITTGVSQRVVQEIEESIVSLTSSSQVTEESQRSPTLVSNVTEATTDESPGTTLKTDESQGSSTLKQSQLSQSDDDPLSQTIVKSVTLTQDSQLSQPLFSDEDTFSSATVSVPSINSTQSDKQLSDTQDNVSPTTMEPVLPEETSNELNVTETTKLKEIVILEDTEIHLGPSGADTIISNDELNPNQNQNENENENENKNASELLEDINICNDLSKSNGSFTPPHPPSQVSESSKKDGDNVDGSLTPPLPSKPETESLPKNNMLNLNWNELYRKTHERDMDKKKSKLDLCDYIVTGGFDNLIKIWDVNNETNELTLRSTIQRHYLGIMTVDVSKDGKYLVTSSMDANVRVWKTETCELISEAKLDLNEFWKLKFSADNNFLITGSPCGKIFLYDVLTFVKAKVLDTRGKFTLSVAISPNNKCIASGAVDGIINIFDAAAARLVHTLEGHAMAIRTMVFSPDSSFLLTGSDDGYMKIYDVQHANLVATVSGHSSWVTCVDITLDGKLFASSSADGTVKLWVFKTKKCIHTFNDHVDQVWSLKFAPDGRRIVSTSDDRTINIYSFSYDEL